MKFLKNKRILPIIYIAFALFLIYATCLYFQVNKWILIGFFIVGVYMFMVLARSISENYFLINENDALSTELQAIEALNQHQRQENPYNKQSIPSQFPTDQNPFKDCSKTVKTRLCDVAGMAEAKEEVLEVIDFLKNPAKYHEAGAKLPRGILFEGPPGTGKTLLARAIAGEANVQFIATSGSEFMETFVGVGSKRVRQLFDEARKKTTLIFIDEIDAIGGKRGMSAGNDSERERTLNQILVEMDGFNEKQNFVVIAATNRKDMLDPALLRPGRFERHIRIGLPTTEERKEILLVHAKNKTLGHDVNIDSLANKTSTFSGAMLQSLLNEAALMAVRDNRKVIHMEDCEEALDRVILGPARKTRHYIERERQLVAYHEAGHAVIGLQLSTAKTVERITIVPRGDAGGYNLFTDKEETFFSTRNMILEEITGLLGGRAAEEIIFKDISSGASHDLKRATELAERYVCDYGMSDLGMVQYSQIDNVSDTLKNDINKQMNKVISDCYNNAIQLLNNNRPLLDAIVQRLLEKETIDAVEVEALAASI